MKEKSGAMAEEEWNANRNDYRVRVPKGYQVLEIIMDPHLDSASLDLRFFTFR